MQRFAALSARAAATTATAWLAAARCDDEKRVFTIFVDVDGVLNSTFEALDGSTVETDPGDLDGPRPWQRGGEAHWRHAVAVVDGRIREQFDCEWDPGVLRLDARGRPDHRRGYFWSIAKVYELVRCTGAESCALCGK